MSHIFWTVDLAFSQIGGKHFAGFHFRVLRQLLEAVAFVSDRNSFAVKTTARRKLNRLSQRKAVAVLAQYYFHATFPLLRSWEEGRRSPNSHTAAILEKFLLDHPTVESPKKLKPR
jgi:DNA-binding transcriptional regulator YiaG